MMVRSDVGETFDEDVARMSGCVAVMTVLGFQTAEEARAFFADEPNALFDEIEEWLGEEMNGQVVHGRDQDRGTLTVGLACVTDAVLFRLRWHDHLLAG